MTIKLLLLKSGEDIIADIEEMSFGEGESRRVVGYFLKRPCVVKMHGKEILGDETATQKKTSYQLTLYPWVPLSKEEVVPLTAEWVVTMTTPIDKLNQMYIEDVVNYGVEDDKTNSSSDGADPGLTD